MRRRGTVYAGTSALGYLFLAWASCRFARSRQSVDLIRGIREVFYQHNPFADNANPTKAEVRSRRARTTRALLRIHPAHSLPDAHAI